MDSKLLEVVEKGDLIMLDDILFKEDNFYFLF